MILKLLILSHEVLGCHTQKVGSCRRSFAPRCCVQLDTRAAYLALDCCLAKQHKHLFSCNVLNGLPFGANIFENCAALGGKPWNKETIDSLSPEEKKTLKKEIALKVKMLHIRAGVVTEIGTAALLYLSLQARMVALPLSAFFLGAGALQSQALVLWDETERKTMSCLAFTTSSTLAALALGAGLLKKIRSMQDLSVRPSSKRAPLPLRWALIGTTLALVKGPFIKGACAIFWNR